MKVQELNREQLTELKQDYLLRKMEKDNKSPSFGELCNIDTLVSDQEVFTFYSDFDFVDDDFFVAAGTL